MRIPRTLTLVLAGGTGGRLKSLTDDHPKPVLPIAGTYRLIDVALSNLAHSHLPDVGIVEQYLPRRLNDYLSAGRPWDLDRNHGGLHLLPPFAGGEGEGFAQGNADALYRQRAHIRDHDPELVLVVSADHLYTLNLLEVIDTHLARCADLTMVTTTVDEDASRYGVVQADADGVVTGFAYKPEDPGGNLVSTEIFCYSTGALLDALDALADRVDSLGDYGEHLVPYLVENARVVEHRYTGYWRDVGTLESYWTANMQWLDGEGVELDDPDWRILSAQPQLPPARVAAGVAVRDAALSPGASVAGTVVHSVIGPNAVVEAGAEVVDSVVLDGARVAGGVRLSRCIVAIGAQVTAPFAIGSADAVTLIGADGQVDAVEPPENGGTP